VATTGVAGPAGGSPEKPVGTVWIAVETPTHARAVLHRLTTDRETNISLASMLALDLVRRSVATSI
jgi:nicotinamide-nucleotide amidase